jgi:hypothetical protein
MPGTGRLPEPAAIGRIDRDGLGRDGIDGFGRHPIPSFGRDYQRRVPGGDDELRQRLRRRPELSSGLG